MVNKVDKQIRITCRGAAMVALDKLEPLQPESFKTLTKKNYGRLKAAILDVGFSFPELVWQSRSKHYIVDGHQRVRTVQQMLKEGYTLPGGKLPVSFTEAKSKKEALRKIAMGTSQYGEYDEESMYEFMHLAGLELSELKEWGSLLQLHMGKLEVGYFRDVDPADDEVPEPPKKAITKHGDLWELGDHRLFCGDATVSAQTLMDGEIANLVFTDPPYGVDYDGGTTPREKLKGDASTDLYGPACTISFSRSDDSAALYLWHAGVKGIAAAAAAAAAAAGYSIRCELVWNKNQAQFGALSAQYKQKHEPAYYCHKKGKAPRWYGPTNEVTVWDVSRASVNEYHPTQKPVELAARAVANSSEEGHIVADWFLGSGTTMIAAEKLNRRCFGIEIECKYVDVAVERWEQFSGGKAKRIKAK